VSPSTSMLCTCWLLGCDLLASFCLWLALLPGRGAFPCREMNSGSACDRCSCCWRAAATLVTSARLSRGTATPVTVQLEACRL
jgi:hypothetical protein